MNIDEMRHKIREYCHSRSCIEENDECPLYSITAPCYEGGSDELIERNYNLLFSKEDEKRIEYDPVNHPEHYNHGKECIEEMLLIFGKEAVMNFCLCNAWKYRKRAIYKNGEEDMAKSDWYIQKYGEIKYG